jgi:hypothetical protein
MTRDAEHRTPWDDAIDKVAHAMTIGPTPDLRSGIRERLDRGGRTMRSWQPALAAAAVLIAMVAWWTGRATPPVNPGSPVAIVHNPQMAQPPAIDLPTSSPAGTAVAPSPVVPVARDAARISPQLGDALVSELSWPEPTNVLPAIAVHPIAIDALAIETATPVDEVQVPRLIVEPLDVEPLSRSNP